MLSCRVKTNFSSLVVNGTKLFFCAGYSEQIFLRMASKLKELAPNTSPRLDIKFVSFGEVIQESVMPGQLGISLCQGDPFNILGNSTVFRRDDDSWYNKQVKWTLKVLKQDHLNRLLLSTIDICITRSSLKVVVRPSRSPLDLYDIHLQYVNF